MRLSKTIAAATLVLLMVPSTALASDATGVAEISPVLWIGAGVLALVLSAGLLIEMLALRRLATGSALAENISFAVLAAVCLAASVLVGWVGRFLGTTFSAEQARLGADLLAVVAIALFAIFFHRVRRAMANFLGRLTDNDEDLIAALDEDARQGSTHA